MKALFQKTKSTSQELSQTKRTKETDNELSQTSKPQNKRQKTNANKSKKKSFFTSFSVATTAQKSIKYNALYEDGLCDLGNGRYSISFFVSDINYQIAKKEDQLNVFTKWCEFLNQHDSSIQLQITVRNRFIDSETLKQTLQIRNENNEIDVYRNELNSIVMSKAIQGQNAIVRERYITASFPADNFNQAVISSARVRADIEQGVLDLGSNSIYQSGTARVQHIASYFNDNEYDWDYSTLIGTGLTTKDYVVPDYLSFSPSKFFEFRSAGKTKYGQVLFLRNYPPNMADKLFTDISDIPCEISITQHIEPVEQDKARTFVMNQIAKMDMEFSDRQQKAVQAGTFIPNIPFELQHKKNEAVELLDDLTNKDQKLFKSIILVYTCALSQQELADNVHQIMSVARKNNCGFASLDEQQEGGINSILPLGTLQLDIHRTLNTAATAITIPFSSMELLQPGGLYYGVNALSQRLIMFDRTTLQNGNGFILGVPGSGKSMAAKVEIVSNLMRHPDDDVIIIDPEREFGPLADAFDGEVIHISAGSTNHINPMDISDEYSGDDDPLKLKTEFILSLCEMLIGNGRQGLQPDEQSVIDRAIGLTYEKYYVGGKRNMPTLEDFYSTLLAQPEPVAKGIALSLEIFVNGSLSTFAKKTNVETHKRFVIYDTRDLGKKLKTLGLLIVLDQVWNRITANKAKGKRTWLYTDEFYLLFQDENSANYYYELYKRARKYGAYPIGITQNVTDLLRSDTACSMLSNAEFLIVLNQSTTDREALSELRNISPQQQRYITNAKPGHGLLLAGKAIIPFANDFPKETKLYRMMTTKPDEVAEIMAEKGK